MKYKINQDYLTLIIDTQFENKTIDDVFNHFKLSKKSIHLLKQNKEYFLNHQFVPSSTLLKQ
ncbi:MAG: RluA family pseudouridine synthase, partial [Beduini sp.]